MHELQSDPDYQSFVNSMAQHCRCAASYKPCDGVLAGGPCDQIDHDEMYFEYDDEIDENDAEYLCIKCGTREAIINRLCGMCSELHPSYM